jgi:hypothetical protein
MWAATCEYDNSINNCKDSGDRKFVKLTDGSSVSSASCLTSGSDICAQQPVCKENRAEVPCPWCCQSAWAVTDNNVWIGWLAETAFTLPPGVNTTFNRLIVHFNGGTGATVGQTTTSVDVEGAGICFDCDGRLLVHALHSAFSTVAIKSHASDVMVFIFDPPLATISYGNDCL